MRNWVSSIFIVVLDLVVVSGQETLYGLPPIPGEPLPSTTTIQPTTHRLFRFGPFLPYMHHHSPLPHPTLPPFLAHPFDTYNNINPIPELPPQPEAKYNGYYDLDGNFVSYDSDRARGYGARRPKREVIVDSKDEALHQKLLEEEYAYDEEDSEQKTTVSTTTKGTTVTTTTQLEEKSTTNNASTTISITENPTTSTISTSETQNVTTKSTETSKATTQKSTPTEVKPTQLPTKPLFVSGNARPRHHSNVIQNDMSHQIPKVKNKLIDHNVTFKEQSSRPLTPYRVNKKPTQINSQQFAKGLIVPRQHQRPIQNRPPPNLQAKFINTHKKIRTRRPKLPSRRPVTVTRKPLKTHQRQFQPAPLKVAPKIQNQFPPQQQPQFIPFQQQRAWAAPAVIPDTREPQVIAYLKDIEDYDWSYTGERPNLEGPVQAFQRQNGVTTPETLVPLNNRQQALVGTTPSPYIPPRVTQPPSYTAPPPVAQTPSYTLAPFAPAQGNDPFGFFSGTPHPLLDVRRLFSGGIFGGR